jgi:hypothetical protein
MRTRRTSWGMVGLLMAVAVSGCRHGAVCWPYPSCDETIVSGPPHPAPEGMTWQLVPNGAAVPSAPPVMMSEPPARLGLPTTEAPCPPAAPKTVFVRGPQQRIIIERDCPPAERPERAGAPTPAAPPPERAAAAVSAAQDVLLIPRTVYVPYVAQTPTRAARLVQPVVPEERAALPAPPPEKDRVGTPQPALPPPQPALQPCPTEMCPDECGPTTIIEIRQMNQRIDRLHRMLERLVPGNR